MQLTLPAEEYYEHTSLNLLIKQSNESRSRTGHSEGQRPSARLTQSSMNRRSATSRSSASQQRRQQAFERSTQREPSGSELMNELPSTAVSFSQSSARGPVSEVASEMNEEDV